MTTASCPVCAEWETEVYALRDEVERLIEERDEALAQVRKFAGMLQRQRSR